MKFSKLRKFLVLFLIPLAFVVIFPVQVLFMQRL